MWKSNGFDLEELIKENDRLEALLSAVAMGEKKWKQGIGWVDVE